MEQNKITKEQALQILENATGELKVTRNEQALIIQSLQVLSELVKESEGSSE